MSLLGAEYGERQDKLSRPLARGRRRERDTICTRAWIGDGHMKECWGRGYIWDWDVIWFWGAGCEG